MGCALYGVCTYDGMCISALYVEVHYIELNYIELNVGCTVWSLMWGALYGA